MTSRARSADSVVDGLKEVYTTVASLKLLPDAGQHAELLDKLTQALLGIIQQITQQKAQQAAQMQGQVRQQAMGGGSPMGGLGMNPMMGGQQPPSGITAGRPQPGMPGGPPSQGSPGLAMPDPDEMRRMLQTQGQGG